VLKDGSLLRTLSRISRRLRRRFMKWTRWVLVNRQNCWHRCWGSVPGAARQTSSSCSCSFSDCVGNSRMLGEDRGHDARALAVKAGELWAYHGHQQRGSVAAFASPVSDGEELATVAAVLPLLSRTATRSPLSPQPEANPRRPSPETPRASASFTGSLAIRLTTLCPLLDTVIGRCFLVDTELPSAVYPPLVFLSAMQPSPDWSNGPNYTVHARASDQWSSSSTAGNGYSLTTNFLLLVWISCITIA
jgi:hypothetical protein